MSKLNEVKMIGSVGADLVLINGKVVTVDSRNTITEAVAVKYDKIMAVGKNEEIKSLIGPDTKVIDLDGKTICPGFIDTHVHFSGGVSELFEADVRTPPLKSITEILQIVKRKAEETPRGEWIVGSGSFSADYYIEEKRYPIRWELDEVAPEHPVALKFGAHVTVANSKALELSGVNKDTPQPKVGHIDKDPDTGEPTGIFRERAAQMVLKLVPPYTIEEIKEGLKNLFNRFLKEGLTSVHDIVSDPLEIRALQELKLEGMLPVRVMFHPFVNHYKMKLESLENLGLSTCFGDNWLKLGGAKMVVDGGMTGRNAAVYEHYVGEPENYGLILIPQTELNDLALKAHSAGLQLVIHAIGDKATDMVVDAIEYALNRIPTEDTRPRIEHLGNNWCTPERIKRIKQLGIIAVPDPQFIWNIADSYVNFLGPHRTKDLFNFRTLLNEGVKMAWSSDGGGKFSVSPTDPILGLACVLTRKTMLGNIINPDQKITMMEAIKFYTLDSAYVGFEENIKGSIEPGKLADLVVLSEDPLTIDPERIRDIMVITTIVGGEIKYHREF